VAFVAEGVGQAGIYLSGDNGSLSAVADRSTNIPNGTNTFFFFSSPSVSNGSVVFQGSGVGSNEGIYMKKDSNLITIANTQTPIPHGTGTFNRFFGASSSGNNVAFTYSQAGNAGVYVSINGTLDVLADLNTTIPGKPEMFGNFVGIPSIDGEKVAFVGQGYGFNGIVTNLGGALEIIADGQTTAPGSMSTFASSGSPLISGSDIAFYGTALLNPTVGMQPGIYIDVDGTIHKIINLNNLLDGRKPLLLGMESGLWEKSVVFQAQFEPGITTQSLYLARAIPEPSILGTFTFLAGVYALRGLGGRSRT
jgi:hypothetical protein